jgi:hypothetical protein
MTLDDEAQRCALIVALYDWRDTERLYSEKVAKYVGAWWLGDEPPTGDNAPQPVTPEAVETLDRIRKAADEARAAYYALAVSLSEIRG